ncbi:MAG: hypothetical protein BWY69_01780 [Planctomycetes bacterium ADurb.Bin401]|nr:MAG: hypothetical protein BWY69_01780 [Planctomycetes bacterium ADurb.Bin401]
MNLATEHTELTEKKFNEPAILNSQVSNKKAKKQHLKILPILIFIITSQLFPINCKAEENKKVIAVVMDKEIFACDIEPNATIITEKQNQLAEKQFTHWLKQYKGALLTRFIIEPLLQQYADSNDFDPNQNELDECQKALIRIDTLANNQIQILSDIRKELEYPDIDEYWKKNVEHAVKSLERQIESLNSHKSAENEIRFWKLNKELYETYGGRVTRGKLAYIPFDGHKEFLTEQQKLGKFNLADENIAKLFWDYYAEYTGPFVDTEYNGPLFAGSKPWWLKYAPEDRYEEQLNFVNSTPEELIIYLLDRWRKMRIDEMKYPFVLFISKTHDEQGQRLRNKFAEQIMNELDEFKKIHHGLHDCCLLASFLGPLGAREQIVSLIKEEKMFSCHYGPELVISLGQCGTIEDVPFLIDCIEKESDGSDAVVNKSLKLITGVEMPLRGSHTDKEAWQKWWESQRNLRMKN